LELSSTLYLIDTGPEGSAFPRFVGEVFFARDAVFAREDFLARDAFFVRSAMVPPRGPARTENRTS
jgi:hypothetical protein